jgi:hypothetical protein
MGDAETNPTNPFAQFSPEDQASIREQFLALQGHESLNPAQRQSVARALGYLKPPTAGSAEGFQAEGPSTGDVNDFLNKHVDWRLLKEYGIPGPGEQEPAPGHPAATSGSLFLLPGPKPAGMIAPGNINLNNRPIVRNADGSVSTEYSTSFEDDQGREVLVPTIVNGRFLTPDGKMPARGSQAEKDMLGYEDDKGIWHKGLAQLHYEQTGEHMGIFDNPGNADVYAEQVHNRGAATPAAEVALATLPPPTPKSQFVQPEVSPLERIAAKVGSLIPEIHEGAPSPVPPSGGITSFAYAKYGAGKPYATAEGLQKEATEPLLPIGKFTREQIAKIPDEPQRWALNTIMDLGQLSADTVEGLSTPENIGLLTALATIPQVGAAKWANKLVAAGFSAEMAQQSANKLVSGFNNARQGNLRAAGRDFGSAVVGASFSVAAGLGVRGRTPGLGEPKAEARPAVPPEEISALRPAEEPAIPGPAEPATSRAQTAPKLPGRIVGFDADTNLPIIQRETPPAGVPLVEGPEYVGPERRLDFGTRMEVRDLMERSGETDPELALEAVREAQHARLATEADSTRLGREAEAAVRGTAVEPTYFRGVGPEELKIIKETGELPASRGIIGAEPGQTMVTPIRAEAERFAREHGGAVVELTEVPGKRKLKVIGTYVPPEEMAGPVVPPGAGRPTELAPAPEATFGKEATYSGVKEIEARLGEEVSAPRLVIRQEGKGASTWSVMQRYYGEKLLPSGKSYTGQLEDVLAKGLSKTAAKDHARDLLARVTNVEAGGKLTFETPRPVTQVEAPELPFVPGERISKRTGFTKSQQQFLAARLEKVAPELPPYQGAPGEAVTIQVPRDGEFTIPTRTAANALHKTMTGEPLPGMAEPKSYPKLPMAVSRPAPIEARTDVERALEIYGTPSEAIRRLEAQKVAVEADPESYPGVEPWRIESVIEDLKQGRGKPTGAPGGEAYGARVSPPLPKPMEVGIPGQGDSDFEVIPIKIPKLI